MTSRQSLSEDGRRRSRRGLLQLCAARRGARAAAQWRTCGRRSRLPVVVNGKRVKTVDVHAHCLFHEAEKLMGDDNAAFHRR